MNNIPPPSTVKDLNELIKFRYIRKVVTFRGAYYVLEDNK